MLIVADAGPLLSFARADRLALLRDVVGTLIIPEAVYEEIVVRGAGKPGADAVRQAAWITRGTVTDHTFIDQLPSKLNLGEREALALAKEHGGVVLVDEREARRAAQQHGIAHFGSLRVLKEAKDRELLHEVKPILDQLIATGTYISDTLYRSFLRDMDEEEVLPERDLC
jgi:predicted nucleic acid-binding protein